jgi:hypothetical protein
VERCSLESENLSDPFFFVSFLFSLAILHFFQAVVFGWGERNGFTLIFDTPAMCDGGTVAKQLHELWHHRERKLVRPSVLLSFPVFVGNSVLFRQAIVFR